MQDHQPADHGSPAWAPAHRPAPPGYFAATMPVPARRLASLATADLITQYDLAIARRRPDRPMLRSWRDGGWRTVTWAEFALRTAAVAAGLRAAGVSPGDRVLLVSESRPEFNVADAALMAIGAVTVPTYTTNLPSDHAHVLRDSGARAAV